MTSFEHTFKILVIEDIPIASRLTRFILEKKGCLVDCVANGEEALTQCHHAYDLILLDLGLPGMDGFETARQLRLHFQIPIIALTAKKNDRKTIALIKKYKMNGYVFKPLSDETCEILLNNLVLKKDFFCG